jgi:hypothetical protein
MDGYEIETKHTCLNGIVLMTDSFLELGKTIGIRGFSIALQSMTHRAAAQTLKQWKK